MNQLKMSKRKFFVISSAALLCIVLGLYLCSYGEKIHAYFQDGDETGNLFSVGYNRITPEEDFEKPIKDEKTAKSPTAKNTGKVDCYVRGRVLLSDSRAGAYLQYYNNDLLGFNTKDWVEETDGWMYYQSVLKVGENTSPIFTHIQLSDSIPDGFLGFTIDVLFESVQSDGSQNAKEAFCSLGKGGALS